MGQPHSGGWSTKAMALDQWLGAFITDVNWHKMSIFFAASYTPSPSPGEFLSLAMSRRQATSGEISWRLPGPHQPWATSAATSRDPFQSLTCDGVETTETSEMFNSFSSKWSTYIYIYMYVYIYIYILYYHNSSDVVGTCWNVTPKTDTLALWDSTQKRRTGPHLGSVGQKVDQTSKLWICLDLFGEINITTTKTQSVGNKTKIVLFQIGLPSSTRSENKNRQVYTYFILFSVAIEKKSC